MTLPNFILFGVPKAGTSSLREYLNQHPDVFIAREPRFLHLAGQRIRPGMEEAREFRVTSLAEYEALFTPYAGRAALGDDSPSYIMYPEPSIAGIREHVPEAKLIAVFRHPADRGYSEYLMFISQGQEPCRSYRDALRVEQEGRRRDNRQPRQYFRRGFYDAPTRQFLAAFPRENFLFLLYDDLAADPQGVMRSIFRFLRVDPEFAPDMSRRYRVSRWPRHFHLHRMLNSSRSLIRRGLDVLAGSESRRLLNRVNARNLTRPPALDPGLRRELTLRYREDILRFQDTIGRDLSGWLAD